MLVWVTPDHLMRVLAAKFAVTILNLEEREGFEPPVLRICNPVHWASLPPFHISIIYSFLTMSTYYIEKNEIFLVPGHSFELRTFAV